MAVFVHNIKETSIFQLVEIRKQSVIVVATILRYCSGNSLGGIKRNDASGIIMLFICFVGINYTYYT